MPFNYLDFFHFGHFIIVMACSGFRIVEIFILSSIGQYIPEYHFASQSPGSHLDWHSSQCWE